ncbi:alpha/beta-hydrolase [Basidiobolus meristosporus CBS 931.73]|uniref:Lipase n=1 Tax=Basidiobolus meristosporus CBS 931.73 TaxID=1314790 RepID=A0A1Y1YF66_9FUNG|nr:alpha/beta-hydrolase [Basidiobolus meristosporus CBS 931.73]|eukprot:ORX96336.1 alpha/beta-hydrolase [Basidiobolus meristosporus CBS 931.73]
MDSIPVLGRMKPCDYFRIVLTFLFFISESVLRLFFRIYSLVSYSEKSYDDFQYNKKADLKMLESFASIASYWGYPYEEHIVKTQDGYLLGTHRLDAPRGHPAHDKQNKPVVLLWHGFMMNSEGWICNPKRERNLGFMLAEAGYDVWFGNTRGNKYSYKHLYLKPNQNKFWDFSIDEYALYDLPNTVDFILETTGASSLVYIGFSQGTAQAFASLSIHPELNRKISLFVALAPAITPGGLYSSVVDTFLKATPNIAYLLLGKKRALSSAVFWNDILPRPIFVKTIDASVKFLFGWQCKNIDREVKEIVYGHLYSYASVKGVVHWFQIINSGSFTLFDEYSTILPSAMPRSGHVCHPFATNQITTPIAMFYGGSDSLCNIDTLKSQLPELQECHEVKHFEHLDFLWARDAKELVYSKVLRILEQHAS